MSKRLIRLIIKIIIVVAIVFTLDKFVIKIRVYHSNDMYPSIRDGQLVVAYQLSKEFSPEDIVLYTMNGEEHLGRVLTHNGTVEIDDNGNITVNGNSVLATIPFQTEPGYVDYPYEVKDGYFVLNDYRQNQTDSRTYGTINEADIIGKVVFSMQYRGF